MDATMEQASPRARWYIVHTYSGFEQRVEQTVREMMRTGQDKDLIEEVVMPTEKIVEMVKGERKTSTRKFYPGYIMIKMILTDDTWHLIQSIPRVTGFVGGKNRPTPMRDSEAENILNMMESRVPSSTSSAETRCGSSMAHSAGSMVLWKMSITTRENSKFPSPFSGVRLLWSSILSRWTRDSPNILANCEISHRGIQWPRKN